VRVILWKFQWFLLHLCEIVVIGQTNHVILLIALNIEKKMYKVALIN